MFVNYRCVSAMSRRASGGFLSPSSRTVLVFEYPESLFLVRAANPCQFPVFGVSVPIVRRVFLGAYVRAFPLDPVTTRPAMSALPEPASVPFGCSATVNGEEPFFTVIRIWVVFCGVALALRRSQRAAYWH